MNKSTKYTKAILEPIVASSFTYAEVIQKLGIKWSGGQQQNIKRWISVYELSTIHFLGRGNNRGKKCGGSEKKHWTEILILQTGKNRREKAYKLRRALIESGRIY